MKKNKFMTRVFSAMENQETEVLDQIQNDLEIAKEDGELDSEEYKITWDPDQEVFVLHDKINNEHTEISEDEEAAFYMTDMTDANEGIPTPEESIPELSVNDEVKWTDELGHEHQGMITMISDGIATILENEVEVAAPIESLMKVEAPVEKIAEVDYTFSEKVEDYEFSFVEKKFGNPVSSDIPEGISSKLQDLAQTTGCIDYSDIMKMQYTPEKGRKINYLYRVLQENGKLTEKQCQNLKEIVNSVKSFSHIDSPESFREYAHKVMKEAHGNEYSEEVTDKVVDDLLADNPNSDYGELIGRLTSGFGEKEFSNDGIKYRVQYTMFYVNGTQETRSKTIVAKSKSDAEKKFWEWYKENGGARWTKETKVDTIYEAKSKKFSDGFQGVELNGRIFSFIEKIFAKSDAVKKLEFEVSRIKDLYDDVKARQKGETDPVMKSRNKMLLQEIKVKLEQAKLAVYKKEFEESRSKNFSFVEKTFSVPLPKEFRSPTSLYPTVPSNKQDLERFIDIWDKYITERQAEIDQLYPRGDKRRSDVMYEFRGFKDRVSRAKKKLESLK